MAHNALGILQRWRRGTWRPLGTADEGRVERRLRRAWWPVRTSEGWIWGQHYVQWRVVCVGRWSTWEVDRLDAWVRTEFTR